MRGFYGLTVMVLVLGRVFPATPAMAKPKKDLWVVDGRFVWGKNPEEMIGLRFPGALTDSAIHKRFPKEVVEYPSAGANTVLVACQSEGQRFFNRDGTLSPEAAARLRNVVESVRFWSGTPIITLFDPSPTCRLESEDAYLRAAVNAVETLRGERGFLFCVSERCDDPRWGEGTPALRDLYLVDRIAAAIHDASPGRVVAAGGTTPGTLLEILRSMPDVDALMARVPRLGFGKGTLPFDRKPVIEIVSIENLSYEELRKGIDTVYRNSAYAFAVDMDDGIDEKTRKKILRRLSEDVNRYQIEEFHGVPPDPEDTFSLKPGEAEEGFLSMFNGKNLNGWVQLTAPGDFQVIDGCIEVVGKGGGWLRSYYPYKDFIFRGEYAIAPGKNSGFWFRAQKNGRSSRIGFEFQILGTPPDAPRTNESHGSIYDVRPPDKNCAKRPGEWHEVEVTCIGSHIRIVWNGEVVHDLSYEDHPMLKNRKREGYIGLTDHHGSVRFRNLRIKPLERTKEPNPN